MTLAAIERFDVPAHCIRMTRAAPSLRLVAPPSESPPTAAETPDPGAREAGPPPVHPVTPDGRYFVVKGLLWRRTNPNLDESTRVSLVRALMAARRDVGAAGRRGDQRAVAQARLRVDAAKRGLGERGPVWWTDGAQDFNRRQVDKTPYAAWFAALEPAEVGRRAEGPRCDPAAPGPTPKSRSDGAATAAPDGAHGAAGLARSH